MLPKTVESDVSMARLSCADSHVQVETETTSLRQELETARLALRLQTTRCRQVDAALSRKLEQKETEVKTWKTLRDQQLSYLLRALMALEARLRREQRNIRCQLGERDAVIRAQQVEIARLRKMLDSEARQEEVKTVSLKEVTSIPPEFDYDCNVKPDLISSLGITNLRRSEDKSLTPTNTDNEDSQSNLDSLQLSFYEIGSQPESLVSNLSTQSCQGDTPESNDPAQDTTDHISELQFKYPHEGNGNHTNPTGTNNNNNYIDGKCTKYQESSNIKHSELKVQMDLHPYPKNILSPVKEESVIVSSASSSPVRFDPCEDRSVKESVVTSDCKPSPSTLLQEVRISGRNEYEDNPVLNCVNQILLRDQEEFLEEQRALRLKEQERIKREAEVLNNKKLTKSTENLSLLNEHHIIIQNSQSKSKVYPSLSSASPQDSHSPEQLIIRPSREKTSEDLYKTVKNIPSPMRATPPKENAKIKVTPPALPPKPLKLLQNRQKSLDQKTILNSILPQDVNAIEIIKNHVPLPQLSNDNELYVISNSAIDDELLQQLQGRKMKSCSDLTVALNKSKPMAQSRESVFAPLLPHPMHKPPPKPTSTSPKKDKSNTPKTCNKKSPSYKEEETLKTTPKQSPTKKVLSPTSCIKVASPVSSLLNSGDAVDPDIEGNCAEKTSPSVSQIVRKFEVLGTKSLKESETDDIQDDNNSLQKNFEEFRLDECDMDALCDDDGRPEGDGAETQLNGSAETKISYENFLEATGLSQKSIMTPSRMFSNHKSVMKPKDVKHRSRVKAAAVVDRCNNNNNTPGPVVRYWTEPFL